MQGAMRGAWAVMLVGVLGAVSATGAGCANGSTVERPDGRGGDDGGGDGFDAPRADRTAPHEDAAEDAAGFDADAVRDAAPDVPAATMYYCPADPVARRQAAVLLLRVSHGADYAPPPATGTMFSDVPASHPQAAWIEQLSREGITNGCGGGAFCPDAPLTRRQAAVFLLRVAHGASYMPPPATGTVFSDVPAGDPQAAWIEQLSHEGISNGCGGGRYCPNDALLRQQAAPMLLRVAHGASYAPPPASGAVFVDVPADHPQAAWIEQLFRERISGGCR